MISRLPSMNQDLRKAMNDEKMSIAKIKRIMIVEENDDINLTFRVIQRFSDRRLKVYAFNDPFDALQEFRPNFYDLIIIDIAMPKINGFKFHDIVRTIDKKVKICLLSTTSKDVIKERNSEVETL